MPSVPFDLPTRLDALRRRDVAVAVIGLGYVGLPLARSAAEAGFRVVGIDIDPTKIQAFAEGRSYIRQHPYEGFAPLIAAGRFRATLDMAAVVDCAAVLICVPTPLTRQREPDLRFVAQTATAMAPHLRPGHLVVLESTTYPGTTREVLAPILEAGGLKSGRDLFLAYSPEREDPGNVAFDTGSIPKVVGADGDDALALALALYDQFVARTVPVSGLDTAEAVKITENIFRAVNIALVNELKVVYAAMGIDIWEVIEAAKTKPFGFMPFYPGPGLGGHCIPIDPFYLTWKAREFEVPTRFVELAGEINTAMPRHVVGRVAEELDARFGKGLNGAQILVVGVAYKKNVDDMRESPALRLIELMEERGATVSFHDPLVPTLPPTRAHGALTGRQSQPLDEATLAGADVVLIATDHDGTDWALVQRHAALVVDTRNALARAGATGPNVAKA